MFMLAGLVGLLVAGLAVDMTGLTQTEPEPDPDDLPPADIGDGSLPPIMPDDPWDETGEAGLPAGTGPTDGQPTGPVTPEPVLEPVVGSDLADLLMGGDGADLMLGHGGDDDLRGGAGDDTIHAGDGNDWVQGDAVYGPGGNDVIHGGAGDDSLCGQGGDDLIPGDSGDDTIFGGEGHDTLMGGAGTDWLSGNDGDDVLISGGGADDLDGGRGNDRLIGSDDADMVWMHGGEGDDTLEPGAGDYAEGLAGADSFVLKEVSGIVPIIADFSAEEDVIHLHLGPDVPDDVQIGLREDLDGSTLIEVNGAAVGRLLQAEGLRPEDIVVRRGLA
ncbi:calcium-binding protein [Paracoccus stylophorae]|uniref:Calcium-binding protein n=1 Tax=Paracoccus stylophorae TaxID=659350 RepID=A0ABY7STP3_9RHOB|nr:calcium-binding protein [Paracoccus stylophorae]WCR10256.1 calcium-binding protein [Paracoccus stylophorae]